MSMENRESKEELDQVIPGDWVDVTDDVECYAQGKSFECECGQGFGTEHNKFMVKCPTCSKYVVDRDADDREDPREDKSQMSLTDF